MRYYVFSAGQLGIEAYLGHTNARDEDAAERKFSEEASPYPAVALDEDGVRLSADVFAEAKQDFPKRKNGSADPLEE